MRVSIANFFVFALFFNSFFVEEASTNLVLPEETEEGFSSVCGAKEFACGNTTICLERSLHCDGIQHCAHGEDEEGCSDAHGSLDSLVKAITHHQELKDVFYDKAFDNCSLDYVPPFCQCRFYSLIYCENHPLTTVPKGVGGSVTKMVLTNVSLTQLPRGAFSEYKKLKIIHIEGNKIPILGPGPFLGLPNVTFLLLMKNEIHTVELRTFEGLRNLRWLLMQGNQISMLNMSVFTDVVNLEVMDLTENHLTKLGTFPSNLQKLFWLGLGQNRLQRIHRSTFRYLLSLEVLILKNNVLEDIDEAAFATLGKLTELDISYNRLTYLKPALFYNLRNLNKLNLEFNQITTFPIDIFKGLSNLKSLDLQGLNLKNIDLQMFHPLKDLQFIYFERFIYCSYAPYVRICLPKTDGLSTTENLLSFPALRMSVCLMAFVTCAGNTLVLSWRVLSRREDQILSFFIKNLAVADLLMGIYLVAIGVQDISFRDTYNKYAHAWMSSAFCNVCGILAMISSEVSVLILSLITIERHRCIRTNVRVITASGARYSCACVWIVGIVLAFLPVFMYKGFYSSNGLCFPLHIDYPFNLGYEYSAFVFFGINFSAVILIMCLYASMFLTIKRDRESARPVILKKNEDAVLLLRFSFIVLTDSACWIPIVIIKLLALVGVAISHNLYSVIVVLILPINSAINPLLYTIAAPTELRKRIEKYFERVMLWLQRMDCIVKSGVSTSSSLTRSVTVTESRCLPSSTVNSGELELCMTTI